MFNEFKKLFQRPFILEDQHLIHNGINFDLAAANLTDVEELLQLQKIVYPNYQPWNRQTYMYELTRHNTSYLKVTTANQVVGVMGLAKRNRREAHITNIGILPSFQNQGLGHLLLNLGFKLVKEKNFNKLTLEVDAQNERAIQLYKSLGFYEVKSMRNYYDNGHDGLELCKQINK